MTCNNPKLDLVNMNAYIKFGETISVYSQDIECKKRIITDRMSKSRAITLVQMAKNDV